VLSIDAAFPLLGA
jgi:hypothetical protein